MPPFKRRSLEIFSLFLFFILISAFPTYLLFAQVMESGTYKIQTDSINFGGESSSSANYNLNDTLGEVATGESNSANYYMHAGYWQMQESYISITSPSDLALANIGGITGENSEGLLSWQVITDNTAGYTMTIKTNTTPALTSALDSFADYTPAGADPDYDFSISPLISAFGFSPEGTDTNNRFKDNGATCNIGTGETVGKCWDGLSTSPKDIAGKTSSNHPSGSTVDVRFRVESGSSHIQTSGSYSASIIVTALTL
ncbi:MAG: hypothetical protein WA060_03650 [Minisyncoccia bacterium]